FPEPVEFPVPDELPEPLPSAPAVPVSAGWGLAHPSTNAPASKRGATDERMGPPKSRQAKPCREGTTSGARTGYAGRLGGAGDDGPRRTPQVPDEAEELQHAQHVERHVDLPPAEAVVRRALVVVVVVVPALAGRQHREEPVVARVVGRLVAAFAKQMRQRI